MKREGFAAILAAAVSCPVLAGPALDVASFVKRARFDDIKLSPNGDYYAASVPAEGRSGLLILRRADNVGVFYTQLLAFLARNIGTAAAVGTH